MSKKDFAHLHVHTEYSILDGINRINDLAKHVKEEGMTSCAITDHGTLYGLVEFYKEFKKHDLRPLIGVEAYLTEDEDGIENNKDKHNDNYHCILIAENDVGLRNLFWLTNQANLHNFYYRPRISLKNLEAGRAEGLIATSSCLGGSVAKRGSYDVDNRTFTETFNQYRRNGKLKSFTSTITPSQSLERMARIFNNKFFAEIQDNPEFWEQEAYNKWLIPKAREMGIPLVITADAHFLKKEDKSTHDLVMAHQMKCTLEEYTGDEDGMSYGDGHYVRSPEDMYKAALKYGAEDAFWNTTELTSHCDANISLGDVKLPHFEVSEEDDYEDFKRWKSQRTECEAHLA